MKTANGRFPAIIDHGNNDFKMFESNAIIEYLLEKYQGDSKVAINSFEERQEARQWLSFQGSGQGVVFQDAACKLGRGIHRSRTNSDAYNASLHVFGRRKGRIWQGALSA